MEQIDLKSQLNNLTQLQALDSEIYALNNEKQSIPAKIEAIKKVFEDKKQRLLNLEKQFLDLQKQKKDVELELGGKEDGIKKLQGQLFQLKTNKEYQLMLQQISDAKADNSVIEDKILQIMEQIDNAKGLIEKEKQNLALEEKTFIQEKKTFEEKEKEIDDSVVCLEAKRKQIIPGISASIFSQYERILKNRNGLAIVTAKNNSCQGCNMFVPAQIINLIKMYKHIVTCENCNRILYITDDET